MRRWFLFHVFNLSCLPSGSILQMNIRLWFIRLSENQPGREQLYYSYVCNRAKNQSFPEVVSPSLYHTNTHTHAHAHTQTRGAEEIHARVREIDCVQCFGVYHFRYTNHCSQNCSFDSPYSWSTVVIQFISSANKNISSGSSNSNRNRSNDGKIDGIICSFVVHNASVYKTLFLLRLGICKWTQSISVLLLSVVFLSVSQNWGQFTYWNFVVLLWVVFLSMVESALILGH